MGDFFVEYMPKVLEVVVTPALRSWKTDDQALARNFLLSDSLLVDDLQIPVQKDDLPLLSKFLNRMPSIVVFNMVGLGSLSRDEFQEFDLEPTALPNLRSLRCPLGLLPSFLPGRPIRKLHIQDYAPRAVRRTFRHFEVDAPSLVAVKRTTCAIEELTVPMSIYDNVALEDYFPTLKLLRIDDDRGLPLLIKSHNPEVDELQCNCHQDDPDESDRLGSYGLDLRKQRELLLQLQNAFPEVTKVAVTWSSIRWRRSDATSTDWRPFVADRDSLRTRLLMAVKYPELTPLRLVDEDGCIANVFRPDEMTPALHAMFQPAEQSQ
ncbi:hypothetical protein OE88DRAFT_1734814 [Heliocybe sulcata]|uniref:F-box domain-containing protein n=1 Tax=Heliocybe sulcata TaxID=5364 RepID=A0A5C3N3I3_9AGAM|nr:hypothetical protein OE88DRAFT_1734814 [Heliocybe sulcata]